jgi:hypothetical protein
LHLSLFISSKGIYCLGACFISSVSKIMQSIL